MEFIETSIFKKKTKKLLCRADKSRLKEELTESPNKGAVIPGSGGLRKLRFAYGGQGTRGGLRVIYYWITDEGKILLLFAYPKTSQENLTHEQTNLLKTLVEQELQENHDGR